MNMAKQSLTSAGFKNLSGIALLAIIASIVALFVFGFGFFGSGNSAWLLPAIFIFLGAFAVPMLRKTKIERYYEAVGKAHPDIRPLRRLKKQQTDDGDVYTFRMPVGMSKSQYEKYREGLEQYLDSRVEFRFEHNLIIKVSAIPPER